jgi:hypothetical protein
MLHRSSPCQKMLGHVVSLLFAALVFSAGQLVCLGAPPTVAKLEDERTQLLAQLAEQRTKAINSDPLFQEALRRTSESTFDGLAAKQALNWVSSKSPSDPTINAAYQELLSLCTLDTLLEILDTPHGDDFVRAALLGTPEKAIDESKLADEIVQFAPGTNRQDLDDPSKIWDALKSKALAIGQPLADRLDKFAAAHAWPSAVVRAFRAEQAHHVRVAVYNEYGYARLPPSWYEIRTRLAVINQEIDAAKSVPTTQPGH